jgi:hypothetical protein
MDELLDAPGNRVLLAARDTGRGKRSGAVVEMSIFQVWTFQGRKVVKWQGFAIRDEALEAAGLSG